MKSNPFCINDFQKNALSFTLFLLIFWMQRYNFFFNWKVKIENWKIVDKWCANHFQFSPFNILSLSCVNKPDSCLARLPQKYKPPQFLVLSFSPTAPFFQKKKLCKTRHVKKICIFVTRNSKSVNRIKSQTRNIYAEIWIATTIQKHETIAAGFHAIGSFSLTFRYAKLHGILFPTPFPQYYPFPRQ